MNGTVKREKGRGMKRRRERICHKICGKKIHMRDLSRGKDTAEFMYTNKKGGPGVFRDRVGVREGYRQREAEGEGEGEWNVG